jgi:hypothetical protein
VHVAHYAEHEPWPLSRRKRRGGCGHHPAYEFFSRHFPISSLAYNLILILLLSQLGVSEVGSFGEFLESFLLFS